MPRICFDVEKLKEVLTRHMNHTTEHDVFFEFIINSKGDLIEKTWLYDFKRKEHVVDKVTILIHGEIGTGESKTPQEGGSVPPF